MNQILLGFKRCEGFWQDLNYQVTFDVDKTTITLNLSCMIFTQMKVKTLLEQPLSLQRHRPQTLRTVESVDITANFLIRDGENDEGWSSILNQSNEYLISLFVSQLEFQYPLVFSRDCRKRFLQQEKSLGPISYALTNSSSLIPNLIKIISDDNTATTSYQIVKLLGDSSKLKRMRNNVNKPIPFEILRHFWTCILNPLSHLVRDQDRESIFWLKKWLRIEVTECGIRIACSSYLLLR